MRRTAGGLAAALAVSGVLLVAGSGGDTCAAVADEAGLLAPSSRLDGATELLRRGGVDTVVRTVDGSAAADETAARLAASCRQLTRPDRGAAVVVVHSDGGVTVLGVGSVPPDHAQLAEETIVTRVRAGGGDPSSAVAHGLEQLWQARAAAVAAGDDPTGASGRGNPWTRRQRANAAARAISGGVVTFVVVLLAAATRCRRHAARCARVQAQRARSALAQRYVDLDGAVVAAVARGRSAGQEVPADVAAAVAAADQRACEVLLATAGAAPRRREDALAAAAACAAAERDLREAVREIDVRRDVAVDARVAATFPGS